MRGGALKHSITIQQRTEVGRNSANERIYEWTTFAEVFCEIVARRGTEFHDEKTGQRYAQTWYKFRCRYFDVEGVTETMRISFDGQIYDIKTVMPELQKKDECIIEAALQRGQGG